MIDLRTDPPKRMKELRAGEQYIDAEGALQVVTEVVFDERGAPTIKSRPAEQAEA